MASDRFCPSTTPPSMTTFRRLPTSPTTRRPRERERCRRARRRRLDRSINVQIDASIAIGPLTTVFAVIVRSPSEVLGVRKPAIAGSASLFDLFCDLTGARLGWGALANQRALACADARKPERQAANASSARIATLTTAGSGEARSPAMEPLAAQRPSNAAAMPKVPCAE